MFESNPHTQIEPLVSVLMPCYNHQNYVIDALESVAASDYQNIELIFIDDASQDNSFGIASEWIDKNKERFVQVKYFKHEANAGICKTMNELYFLSTGAYLNYAASDDLVLPSGISNQVRFALENNVDFLFTDCQLMSTSGDLLAESALEYFGKNKQILSKRTTCLIIDIVLNWQLPWNRSFAKSSSLKEIGLFNEELVYEDRDLALRILNSGSFAFLPTSVTCYRYSGGCHTAGLSLEDMRRDTTRLMIKNYRTSHGFLKFLLWMSVGSYFNKHFAPEEQIGSFSLFTRKTLRRLSVRMHRLLFKF